MAKKKSKPAQAQSLLVEVLTEELPPASLRNLGDSFAAGITEALRNANLLADGSGTTAFATPRRLAVHVTNVRRRAPDQTGEARGPAVKAALDASGKPTKALQGFAASRGVDIDSLERRDTPRGEFFYHVYRARGIRLADMLAETVEAVLQGLPARRVMRWGDGEHAFVRPVHGIAMVHGAQTVAGAVLGISSGNRTRGHRFLARGPITIRSADAYEAALESRGYVIASFARRREDIATALEKAAAKHKARVFPARRRKAAAAKGAQRGQRERVSRDILRSNETLLDEVTAMVEWPCVYPGRFEKEFLNLPAECISLSMQKHQRYFALIGSEDRLLADYLMVSNMETTRPGTIIEGNARVLRARLSDARFFYEQDLKSSLADRVPELARVVYHNRLGSQLNRAERLRELAGSVARMTGVDTAHAERAAWLCKADLLTSMVGEFPQLQGVMGAYYASHYNERPEVAAAIEGHYRPRFAGDDLTYMTGCTACVALADKLEALAGMFGLGQQPTGDKDPFGLRRAAIGVNRILIELDLAVDLGELVKAAFAAFHGTVTEAPADLAAFIRERLAAQLREDGYSALEVDAVMAQDPCMIHLVPRQLEAVREFSRLPEAESLAAANKRVVNILRQAEERGESFKDATPGEFRETEERNLYQALTAASQRAVGLLDDGDFTGYLKCFAVLKAPVDAFFDKVMVMTDDDTLRRNRLALLRDLRQAMNRVADISRLAV